MGHLVVDGANVVGSRPDGWWRDRAGAARRLTAQLVAALRDEPARLPGGGAAPITVHLVLEGQAARATDLPDHPDLAIVRAPADGDAAIVELAAALGSGVVVVTADRELRRRVEAAGATTVGPGVLLAALGSVDR